MHLVTPLVARDATVNDGTVQVEPQKGIRTNAKSASLKNSPKHPRARGAWQLSMSARTMQLQNTLNVEPGNPTASGGGDDGDMPSGLPEANLRFEVFAPSDQRLDEPPMQQKTDEQPQTQPKYPREMIDDDVRSIPRNHGGIRSLVKLQWTLSFSSQTTLHCTTS